MTMSGPLLWLVIASWVLLLACFVAAGVYFVVRPRVLRALKAMRRALRRRTEFEAHGFARARTGGFDYSTKRSAGANAGEEAAGANVFSYRTYAAFISYAHADKAFANYLRKRLEVFKLHKEIEANAGALRTGGLGRIFQDEAELGAATDLGQTLRDALDASQNLIVICSPSSAKSHWVNEEVLHFRRTRLERDYAGGADRGHGKIIAVVLSPDTAKKSGDVSSFLPSALREQSADAGGPEIITLSDELAKKARLSNLVIAHMLDVDPRKLSADTSNRAWEVVKILSVGLGLMALFLAFSRPIGRWYLQVFDFLR